MKEAKKSSAKSGKKMPLGATPEESEKRCIALSMALAEKQLQEGTASSQVITHYLKLGSPRAQAEAEKMRLENELLKAKTEALQAEKRSALMFEEAIAAMKHYKGQDDEED